MINRAKTPVNTNKKKHAWEDVEKEAEQSSRVLNCTSERSPTVWEISLIYLVSTHFFSCLTLNLGSIYCGKAQQKGNEIGKPKKAWLCGWLWLQQYIVSFGLHLFSRGLGIEHCDWSIVLLLLPTLTMQFSLNRKQRIHERNGYSASDSNSLIFTRSYRSALVITSPTLTPSLVKTSLKN